MSESTEDPTSYAAELANLRDKLAEQHAWLRAACIAQHAWQ